MKKNTKPVKMRRIVIKVGSNVLTRTDGHPNITNMSSIVDQIVSLRNKGFEVILVSSGAVACGRSAVIPSKKLDNVAQRQLFSAVGQIKLINTYNSLFGEYGITVGQVLTQKENFSSRQSYLNQRSCMQVMLKNGIIPIVNENDTASMTELMFTDNDELSGLIASMMDADTLIILSNIDGIYTGNPSEPNVRLIEHVTLGDDLSIYISDKKSGFGRGGMMSKYDVAHRLATEGVRVIIANGNRKDILTLLIDTPTVIPHTEFEPCHKPVSTIKRWISHNTGIICGSVYISEAAAMALTSYKAVSLLPVGVIDVKGNWQEKDLINIYSSDNQLIGLGCAETDSTTVRRCMGQRGGKPIVHYNYMYITV